MKLRIEVEGGMVTGVYATGPSRNWPLVEIVDLDPAKVGGGVFAVPQIVQSLEIASDIVREAKGRP